MNHFLDWLRSRLSQRTDSEHGQAMVRLAVLLVVLLYLKLSGVRDSMPAAVYGDVLAMVATGFTIGAGLLGWIVAQPERSHLRRGIGMAADYGLSAPVGIALGVLVTTAFGLANGLLVTRVKLPPFIVTLGTLNIAFAITQLYSGSQTITDVSEGMTWLGNSFRIGETNILYGVVLMLALYLITWLFLRETAPGRHIYAVGNSPEATRLTGISTDKVLLGVYVLAGVFYGLASLLSVARIGAGDPNAGQTENLDAITAVVLGGTSLFGGRGIILGTLVGALIVGVFRNGLTLMGVSSVYQILVTGILVILAVMTDQMSRKGVR